MGVGGIVEWTAKAGINIGKKEDSANNRCSTQNCNVINSRTIVVWGEGRGKRTDRREQPRWSVGRRRDDQRIEMISGQKERWLENRDGQWAGEMISGLKERWSLSREERLVSGTEKGDGQWGRDERWSVGRRRDDQWAVKRAEGVMISGAEKRDDQWPEKRAVGRRRSDQWAMKSWSVCGRRNDQWAVGEVISGQWRDDQYAVGEMISGQWRDDEWAVGEMISGQKEKWSVGSRRDDQWAEGEVISGQ